MAFGFGRMKKGFSVLMANMGFGWRALKDAPGDIAGVGQLRAMGRQMRALRPGRIMRGGRGPFGYRAGNIMTLGGQIGYGARRWMTAQDYAGRGAMRGAAAVTRAAMIPGAVSAADFINPWGLGWGD